MHTCKLCGEPSSHGAEDHKPQPYMTPRELERCIFLVGEEGKPMPQIDVGHRLGLTERAVRYYLAGERSIPKLVADEMHRWVAEKAEQDAAREAGVS